MATACRGNRNQSRNNVFAGHSIREHLKCAAELLPVDLDPAAPGGHAAEGPS